MGRRASPWPAILPGPEQILEACWLSLSCAAPRRVQQALLAVGRHEPGRSVWWGNLRTLHPIGGHYGHDRGTPVDRHYIERFLAEPAERLHGDVPQLKGANHSRRLGNEVRCHVVDIDPENTEADLHAGLNIPRSLPAEVLDCLILTQVLRFLAQGTGYGNMLACVAAVLGLSVQDLSAEELDVNDPCFPLVACAHADKPA